MRKTFATTINIDLWNKIQLLALKLSQQEGKKIYINDLIEEGMDYILKKYKNIDNSNFDS
jgi:hypothetical protein